jgi:hypothetical protein
MASQAELGILIKGYDEASGVLRSVSKVVLGFGAVVAGAAATAIALGDATAGAAMNVRKLAIETGLGVEEVSKLAYAGDRLNIDTDMLSKSFGVFSKNLEVSQKKLKEYGVETAFNADGMVDLGTTIDLLADKFKVMPDGVEKTNLAMQLFGKSGKDMIPFLDEGSHGLHALGDEATKMGLVFSQQGVDAAFKFGQAQKDLSDQFEALRNKVGLAVMPALTGLFSFLAHVASDVLPKVAEAIGPVVKILGEMFDVITGRAPDAGAALKSVVGPDVAGAIMGELAYIRDVFKAVMTGDIPGLLKIFEDRLGALVSFVQGFAMTVIQTIHDASPKLLAAFLDWADAAWFWITYTALPELKKALPGILNTVLNFATLAVEELQNAMLMWGRAMVSWVVKAVPPLLASVLDLFTTLLHWLDDHADQIGDTLVSWGQKFGEFIFTVAIPAIIQNLPEILLTIGKWVVTEAIPDVLFFFGKLGVKIIEGIITGLGTLESMVGNAIGTALRAAIESIDFWVGPFHVTGAGGVSFQMPSFGSAMPSAFSLPLFSLPSFDAGGIVPGPIGSPTLAVVHGGETVTPRGGGGAAGGITVNVHVHGDVNDAARFEERVKSAVRDGLLSGGFRGSIAR